MYEGKAKFSIIAFGLATGLLWGLSTLITGLIATMHGQWGVGFVSTMGSMYIGYTNTYMGSIIGGIWGFIDGFIGGAIFALFYNMFLCCCGKKTACCDKPKQP